MSIERQDFDEINEADLQSLVAASTPESLTLEFKRDPYGNADSDKREFLKDVSAFANSAGGHLVIGMAEVDGIASALVGIERAQIDALTNRLESLARDGIGPRLPSLRTKRVDLSNGKSAVIIRVSKSWYPPHIVNSGNHRRFYVRNSGGVHEASIEELRTLFTLSSSMIQKIVEFRTSRVAAIVAGSTPIPTVAGGRLILQIAPLSAFSLLALLDVERIHQLHDKFRPISSMGMTSTFNLDGFANVRGGDHCFGYTQVFRNGIVEATKSSILQEWRGMNIVHAGSVLGGVVEVLPLYLSGLRELGVPAPIVVMMSLQGVAGARLALPGFENRLQGVVQFPPNEPLQLPEIVIDAYGTPEAYFSALRPALDVLWNAAGFSRCTFYNDEGQLVVPQ